MYNETIREAAAGLKANEVRYFKNKYGYDFVLQTAKEAQDVVNYVAAILKNERNINFAAKPVEATRFTVENTNWAYVFFEDGLAVNVLYELTGDTPKRAVGFKLTNGMEVPAELSSFKFATMKSTLAGPIRGSYFVIKNEY